MPKISLVFSILIVFFVKGLALLFNTDGEVFYTLLLSLLLALFVSYVISDSYLFRAYSRQDPSKILSICQYLVLISGLAYLILSEFPMLSSEPHVAKLQVSQYPVLVHLFRNGSIFVALWLIISQVRMNAINNYLYLCMLIAILTAFKGYVVPYILLYAYVNQKSSYWLLRLSLLFLIVVISVEILFERYGGFSVDGFQYIINRLTDLQILGSTVLLENYQHISYTPLVDDIFVLLGKFSGSGALSLQQELYQMYSTDHKLLEMSNLWFLEVYLFLGIGALLLVFLMIMFLYNLHVKFFKSNLSKVFIVYSVFPMADGLMNGKILYKFIDYMLSAFIIYFAALMVIGVVNLLKSGASNDT